MKFEWNKIKEERSKILLIIMVIATVVFTVIGGTLAYWMWVTDVSQHTGVAFTLDKNFSCSADGGQELNNTNIELTPTTDCTDSEHAIQRTIKVTPDIKREGLTISLDMWLNINSIGTYLTKSEDFMYAISTVPGSCKKGMDGYVTGGIFNGLIAGDKVDLLDDVKYTGTNLDADTYYLYLWLNSAENNNNTQNQSFDFSLGGSCSDYIGESEMPALDSRMIPVTIADDGKVTTVSSSDPNWYNYEEKKWANVVMVNKDATTGVANSHPESYYKDGVGKEVTQEDIMAYFVWIPRYKYRISTNQICGEMDDASLKKNSTLCHKTVYAPLDEENAKVKINDWLMENKQWVGAKYCGVDYVFNPDIGFEDEVVECTNQELKNVFDKFIYEGGISYSDYLDNHYVGIRDILTEGVHYSERIGINYDQFHDSDTPTSIDISFEQQTDEFKFGNATSQYRSHPAFWQDADEDGIVDSNELLSGIWVSKFEPSVYTTVSECSHGDDLDGDGLLDGDDFDGDGVSDYCGGTVNSNLLGYLPMKESISGVKNSSDNFRFTFDSNKTSKHQLKDSEWGAVAYFSHSNYGINSEVRINNTITTGCGASTENAAEASNCNNGIKYGSGVAVYPQSTTGNITGVFDMSGGKNDVVYDDITMKLHLDAFMSDIIEYIDISCNGKVCYGHGIEETNWYNDLSDVEAGQKFISNISLVRGGYYNSGSSAGMFAYDVEQFENEPSFATRETIVINP